MLCTERETRFERTAKTGRGMIKPQKVRHHQEASADPDSLLLKNVGTQGKASKETIYSKHPHFYVACVFELARGGNDPRAMLCVRSTCTSLWVGSKTERHQGAALSLFVKDHSTVSWIQGSSVLCLLRLEAHSVAQSGMLSVLSEGTNMPTGEVSFGCCVQKL